MSFTGAFLVIARLDVTVMTAILTLVIAIGGEGFATCRAGEVV